MAVVVALGLACASVAGLDSPTSTPIYVYGVTTLLAIGLYGSASGIPREAMRDLHLLLVAVTLGVVLKALLIAGVMFLVMREPVALVLGITVAQIDPLSVAAMAGRSRLSPRAQALLRAWSAFDDPITALLILYVSAFALDWSGITGHVAGAPADADTVSYLLNLTANLGFAASALFLWAGARWLLRRGARGNTPHPATTALMLLFLAVLVTVAVLNYLMLGIALVGLFFRPLAPKVVDRVSSGALMLAGLALGMLLVHGIDPLLGVVLGLAAFGSQVLVGYALTYRLPHNDRGYLMLGQQNGITAIVLSLTLEPAFPGAVGIVAPAILTVNVLHIVSNNWWARRLETNPLPPVTPAPDWLPAPWRRARR
ncbi:unnamed protein product [[Actinomadura] parvosata subsp. kistnae]|uniref:Cation/H+ exchanger domain-containing protein n=1 Tax=[Actinomadura] parvosata subsp. kistnae TaxID=1909395 RepID=A0A1U9ZQE0_9ACTN|nr:hypothetical protein [Nonomuraea sp. ATCC 55076]AQZ60156.1 hypothetical protein BKM31_00265 [Nonomuraea sp. ATCC 55076]SPL91379.1 unnamed protein product [Actinomadura parvosata subsp. kistnae]